MIDIGYYNGEFGPIDEMKVPMLDRGVYFGDGVYEAVAVRNRVPFALGDHLDRFMNSCRLLEIPSPLPRERLARVLQDMIDRIDGDDAVLYWQATRGTARRERPGDVEMAAIAALRGSLDPHDECLHPGVIVRLTDDLSRGRGGERGRIIGTKPQRHMIGDGLGIAGREAGEQRFAVVRIELPADRHAFQLSRSGPSFPRIGSLAGTGSARMRCHASSDGASRQMSQF